MSKQNNVETIVTHAGVFHADDVCAVAWLRIVGVEAGLARRVPSTEELADPNVLVVDVGGRHEPSLSNFDHHQRGGAGARWDSEIPYSGFGLVYDQFQPSNAFIAQRLHDRAVLPVDAIDTGWAPELEVWRGPDSAGLGDWVAPGKGHSVPPQPATLSFSAVISGFNPGPSASPAERDAAFETAVAFAQQVLENELRSAEEFVAAKEAVLSAHTTHAGSVLVLEKFVPWGEHVFCREDEANLLYVLFPSERGGWMCQQIPVEPGSFEGRKPLPAAWAGLRDEAFAKATGVADGVFCHPGRFIGGAKSRAGAECLAALAVEA